MTKEHHYNSTITWTGNKGLGTLNYKSYERSYQIIVEGKPVIEGSSDPSFLGEIEKHNPEELLLASVSSCHMLWYLHLCSVNNIQVLSYSDKAKGKMIENKDGSGRFTEISLHPTIIIQSNNNIELANSLHHEANKKCFIANTLNIPVLHFPKINQNE